MLYIDKLFNLKTKNVDGVTYMYWDRAWYRLLCWSVSRVHPAVSEVLWRHGILAHLCRNELRVILVCAWVYKGVCRQGLGLTAQVLLEMSPPYSVLCNDLWEMFILHCMNFSGFLKCASMLEIFLLSLSLGYPSGFYSINILTSLKWFFFLVWVEFPAVW